MHHEMITPEMRECIQMCLECERICTETITHCLTMGGEHASATHIGLLMDCVDICHVSARYMLRGSSRHVDTCELCSTVCRACSDECSRMAGGDETMRQCADVCNRCAEHCRHMAMTAA